MFLRECGAGLRLGPSSGVSPCMSETHSLSEVPGAIPRVLREVDFVGKKKLDAAGDEYQTYAEPVVADLDKANIITSTVKGQPRVHYKGDTLHAPVLDFDFPAVLLPSTTEGHFHLMIDTMITWDNFQVLLDAMELCGLLEPGYVRATKQRGYSAIRLPWVKRKARVEGVELDATGHIPGKEDSENKKLTFNDLLEGPPF